MHEDGLRVLIVDDSPEIRTLVRAGVECDDRFAHVAEAANGREAIDAAAADPPDVIVLDEDMPVMTGHEALPVLREVVPQARIVLFSATADEIDLRDGPHPDACVLKGSDLFDLLDVMAEPPSGPQSGRVMQMLWGLAV